MRDASICIFSRRLQFVCPQLSQTSEAYSKIGRMKTKKKNIFFQDNPFLTCI